MEVTIQPFAAFLTNKKTTRNDMKNNRNKRCYAKYSVADAIRKIEPIHLEKDHPCYNCPMYDRGNVALYCPLPKCMKIDIEKIYRKSIWK